MRTLSLSLVLLFCIPFSSKAQNPYFYPQAPTDTTTNSYHGTVIADPYQWMEDPEDLRLQGWLEIQQDFTRKLERKQSHKWSLREQIGRMYYYENERSLVNDSEKDERERSKYVFKFKFRRRNRTPDLLFKKRGATNFRRLIDIRDFQRSKEDNVIVTNWQVNEEEELVAIEMAHNGGDWREVYFFDLVSGKQLPDTLRHLRTSSQLIWHGKGVYYDRYQEPEPGTELLKTAKGQALYFHKTGTRQAEDVLLYQNPDISGANSFRYQKLGDDRLFFKHFYLSRGKIYKALSYAELATEESFLLHNFLVYPNSDSVNFYLQAFTGDTVYLKTSWNAPNGKLMVANINQRNKLAELVPQYDMVLRQVNRLGKDKLACIYRKDGQFVALIYNLAGELLRKIDFPEGKKVNYLFENDPNATYTDFCVSSFYHPDLWYRLSLTDLSFVPTVEISVPFKYDELETRYVKYRSQDGTEVPMYITCRKDIELDGNNPVLLYGYGGYGKTVEPSYDRQKTLWLLHGGVLVIPNVRGGGGEGDAWAEAGRGPNKQNAINDFIVAAEYLIQERYTNPQRLAINGGSHGGMLVSAAFTQRPQLFKAVVAEAGVYDMLRFEQFTVGGKNLNIQEFGLTTTPDGFRNLYAYSPMHQLKEGTKYPNVLLITGEEDDRVPPLHSYKFLATLQKKGHPSSLYHLYTSPGAGHGGALTREDYYDVLLYKYYFLFDQLDVKFW